MKKWSLLVAAMLVAAFTLPARSEQSCYIVRPGDNLSRIARKHGTSVAAIIQVNGLTSTIIHPGQQLCFTKVVNAAASPSTLPVTGTLDYIQGTWRAGTSMPVPARSEMPAITLGNWVYVPGGFGDTDRLDRYNPKNDQWQSRAAMPAGRHHLMAVAYNNQLYVFGGAQAQSWAPTNTVWRYDATTDKWQDLNPMPEARLAGAAATLNDKSYIVGGTGGGNTLLEYSPSENTWRHLPGPNLPREHVSAVAFHDEIWVLGGRWHGVGELATVEIYNPTTNTWRNGPELNIARAGFAAVVVNGNLLVAGGEIIINGTVTLDSIEILAPGQTMWQLGPKLLYPIHGVAGAAIDDLFLLLGGSLRAGAIENQGQVQIYTPS